MNLAPFFNVMSLQDIGDYGSLQTPFFISCDFEKYSRVISRCLLVVFKFRVVLLLDWLPLMAREPGLLIAGVRSHEFPTGFSVK